VEKKSLENKYDPQISLMQASSKAGAESVRRTLIEFKLLETTVAEKTHAIIKKFMSDREKINQQFDNDPHH